ncbi:MAG: HD domain-containing phosphohydrolase [Desulfobacteraceae bacterium]|jgi:putative nucleotidyltransferase with HDIG domain
MTQQKTTILFVDDEESILEVASEYFTQKNYHVITAGNGREALDVLSKNDVDCCFTDINMPGMDGLELAEHIREKDMTIPVIVMTGYPSLENTINTLKNGVVDFLIKPVNLDQMELCVRRVLRQRQVFVDNILLKKELASKQRIEALNKELMVKVDELSHLNKIMNDFEQVNSSRELFSRIVELTREVTHADDARLYIISSSQETPFLVNFSSKKSYEGQNVGICLEKLVAEIVEDGIPLLITDCTGGKRDLPEWIVSAMVVPLKIRDKVFGVVTAFVEEGAYRFSEKDLYYLSFMAQKAADTAENIALYETISENLFSTLRAFVKAVEARDAYTKEHSNRVAEMAVAIGREMGCSEDELNLLNFAGRLHDIGKIGIRDNILLKPGRLTDEEFEIIKEHPAIGAMIVSQLGLWDRETQIIRHHHERFDGSGYPDKLKGVAIPFLSRIMSVADAYDAMASDRAYRKKLELEKVMSIIKEGSGAQFDPRVVGAFVRMVEEGRWMFA